MEIIWFCLGIINSLYLIFIFIFRKIRDIDFIRHYGIYYFFLALPALAVLLLCILQNKSVQYIIFSCIFFVYLLLEYLFDFSLGVDLRNDRRLIVPYLALYYVMNYGFIVMTWQYRAAFGAVILLLAALQIAANVWSHPREGAGKYKPRSRIR